MAILKIKDETGKFVDIPAIQGAPGKDGAIQYEAGENITIDGNVISASGGITLDDVKAITGELDNLSTEDKSSLVGAINEVAGNNVTDLYGITVNVVNETMQSCYNTTEIKEEFRKMIQSIYNKGTNNAILNIYNTSSGGSSRIYYNNGRITDKPSSVTFMEILNTGVNRIGDYVALSNSQIAVYCSWNEDIVTIDTISRLNNGAKFLLSTTNTQSYTPTRNYHPATKLYVDTATGDLTTLATEDKSSLVNAINEVANNGGGESYVIGCVCNSHANVLNNPINYSGTDLTNIGNAITSAYDYLQASPIKSFFLYLYPSTAGLRTNKIMYLYQNENFSNTNNVRYTFRNLQDKPEDGNYTLTINGSWSDSTFTITSAQMKYTDTTLATKTYVDDAIASAITTSLEASY